MRLLLIVLVLIACEQQKIEAPVVVERPYGGLSLDEVSKMTRVCNNEEKAGTLVLNEYLEIVDVKCEHNIYSKKEE